MSNSAAHAGPPQEWPRSDRSDEPDFLQFGELAEKIQGAWQQGRHADVERLIVEHPELESHIRQLIPALHILHNGGSGLAQSRDAAAELVLPPSRQLGDYRIVRQIGRGGMGVVFEAEQVSLRRRVAVKVLPTSATWDDRRLRRFQHEAQAAAKLHHPNIVPVYTVGCEQGVHYFAMQFLDGHTLADLIASMKLVDRDHAIAVAGLSALLSGDQATCAANDVRELPASGETTPARVKDKFTAGSGRALASARSTGHFFRFAASLGIQAAGALEHAHEHSIVHRDIKPSNLLVEPPGHLWVTDFGIARFPGDADLTNSGDMPGTARYMSPEQAQAHGSAVDHRSDIYSLGVTLYELLTLVPAVDGKTNEEILRQLAQAEPRRPRRLNSTIPLDLETVVLKAIAKDPDQRYASAQLMADDLQRFLSGEPVLAKRASLFRRARAFAWLHRHAAAAALVSAAAVIALIALAMFFVPHWDAPRVLAQQHAQEGHRMRTLGRNEHAIEQLTTALQLDRASRQYWIERAACYRDTGQHDMAYRDLTEALALHRDLPTLYERTVMARKLEKWDAVAADYGELLRCGLVSDAGTLDLFRLEQDYIEDQLDTYPGEIWLWLAHAVNRTRVYDTAGAAADLRHALELAPGTHWIPGHIGALHLYRGEVHEAIAALSQAIQLQPDCAAYWAHRAAARGYLGQFEDAGTDVTQAVQLAPQSAVPLQIRGRVRAKAGQTEQAIADFEASLRLDPQGETDMWSYFANALRRRGVTPHDREFAAAFLQQHAELAVARAHWGNVCLYGGQAEEAIKHLERASYMAPHDQFVKRKLYDALLVTGDLRRAADVLGQLAGGGRGPANWWYLAEVQRMSGRADVYRTICDRLLVTRLVPYLGGCVALTCAETPDYQPFPPQARALVDSALRQRPTIQMHLASGAVRYRLGEFAAALPHLEHVVRTTDNWHNSFDEFWGTEAAFFLAMAQQKLGQTQEAQATLARARDRLNKLNAALDKPYPDMVWKLDQLQREAESELALIIRP